MPLIGFSRVTKRYPGGFEALRSVSFSIDAGELVLLTGHSGAGKSTLLKLMAAIERPTSGVVMIGNQNVGALRASAVPFLRRRFGFIFQDQKLLYDRSVLDNVLLPLQIAGFDPREARRRASAALERVGLTGRDRTMPVTLSGGEQQRLAIARAVVHRPAIVLADEPTANLDTESAVSIMALFASFNQHGVTLVVATHDQALRDKLAPRIIELRQGQVVS